MAYASVILTYDVIAVHPWGMHVAMVRVLWIVMANVDLAWTYGEIIDRFYTGGRCTDSISLAVQQRRVDTCICILVLCRFIMLVVWVENRLEFVFQGSHLVEAGYAVRSSFITNCGRRYNRRQPGLLCGKVNVHVRAWLDLLFRCMSGAKLLQCVSPSDRVMCHRPYSIESGSDVVHARAKML